MKNFVINRSASKLTKSQYLVLLRFVAWASRPINPKSPRNITEKIGLIKEHPKKAVTVVSFTNNEAFLMTHYIRANRLLKGVSHAGHRLLMRYGLKKYFLLKPPDLFIDIGSNVGELSRYFIDSGIRTISIEPDPIAFHCLSFNLRDQENVTLHNFALGEKETKMKLALIPESADSSLVFDEKYSDSAVEVEVVRGDSLLKHIPEASRVWIKLDAEGFEPEVLRGLGTILKRIELIAIDAGEERLGESTYIACTEILQRCGFHIENFGKGMVVGKRVA